MAFQPSIQPIPVPFVANPTHWGLVSSLWREEYPVGAFLFGAGPLAVKQVEGVYLFIGVVPPLSLVITWAPSPSPSSLSRLSMFCRKNDAVYAFKDPFGAYWFIGRGGTNNINTPKQLPGNSTCIPYECPKWCQMEEVPQYFRVWCPTRLLNFFGVSEVTKFQCYYRWGDWNLGLVRSWNRSWGPCSQVNKSNDW